MRTITLSALTLVCTAMWAVPPIQRWSLFNAGAKAGALELAPTGKGSYRLHQTFFLRGWTDDLHGSLAWNAKGFPTKFEVKGTNQSVAGYHESFSVAGNQAGWSLAGETRQGVPTEGFYLPSASGVLPVSLLWLGETAEIRKGGSLSILSGGKVSATAPTPLDLRVGRKTLHLQQQALSGLGFSPSYLWRDAKGLPIAAFIPGGMVTLAVREGQEGLAIALEQAAGEDQKQRMRAIGASSRLGLGSTYALTQVDLFDSGTRTIRRNQTMVVEAGRIKAIGTADAVQIPVGVRTLPCPGKTLVPGLWDAHSHIGTSSDGLMALASGAVCIYSPGDDPRSGPSLRKAWAEGLEAGPWCLSALLLDGSGPNTAQVATVVDSCEQALKAMEKARAEGYFGIKLYGSLKKDLVPFLIQEGRKRGFWVSGHVPAGYTIQDLVGLGFQEANHIYFGMLGLWPDVKDKTNGMARFTTIAERAADIDLKGKAVQELIACYKANDTVVDPTVVLMRSFLDHAPGTPDAAYGSLFERLPALTQRSARLQSDLAETPQERTRNQASLRKVLGFIRELHEAGIRIVPGTDNEPALGLTQELALYVEAGIPASDVLALATLGTAKVFGQDKETGSLEVGKRADFILVEGDPTQDIRNLERMVWVSKGGTVYDREKLLEGLGLTPKRIGR